MERSQLFHFRKHSTKIFLMKLYVKYMVSLRCKMAVKQELQKLGLDIVCIDLGVIQIRGDITQLQHDQLQDNLQKSGLELLDDKRSIIIEKIKNLIIEMIHYSDDFPKINFSDYVSEKLGYDYTYLSNMFSEVKGISIRQFIIINKIEKVKELLLYDELNINEISYKLHYSSVAHLSSQFKKITGLTPSNFREMKLQREMSLESI